MKRFLRLAGGFVLLGGIAAGSFALAKLAWQQVAVLNPNVAAAIIAGLTATAAAVYNQRQTRLREISESHRKQKVELYGKYMDIIDFTTNLSKEDRLGEIAEGSVPKELEDLFREIRRGFLVWASPDVIKAYEQFRLAGNAGGGLVILRRADQVFRAIRKDLGNSNWGLKEGDLMKLFLKDPSEYDSMMKQ